MKSELIKFSLIFNIKRNVFKFSNVNFKQWISQKVNLKSEFWKVSFEKRVSKSEFQKINFQKWKSAKNPSQTGILIQKYPI